MSILVPFAIVELSIKSLYLTYVQNVSQFDIIICPQPYPKPRTRFHVVIHVILDFNLLYLFVCVT